MTPVLRFFLPLGLALVTAAGVLALGGDHPPGKLVGKQNAQWPAGLLDLINSTERVGGHWVNQGDFFYYDGDAATLNKFLEAYGKLPDTPVTVVLHAGGKPMTGPLGGERKTPYTWMLESVRRGWGAPRDPRLPEKEPGYVVTVHIWLTDAITLDRLVVPKHVDVTSTDDIQRFIEAHKQQKR